MNKKLAGMVLLVIGSVAGCLCLSTQVDNAYELIWHMAEPTLQVLVDVTAPRGF